MQQLLQGAVVLVGAQRGAAATVHVLRQRARGAQRFEVLHHHGPRVGGEALGLHQVDDLARALLVQRAQVGRQPARVVGVLLAALPQMLQPAAVHPARQPLKHAQHRRVRAHHQRAQPLEPVQQQRERAAVAVAAAAAAAAAAGGGAARLRVL